MTRAHKRKYVSNLVGWCVIGAKWKRNVGRKLHGLFVVEIISGSLAVKVSSMISFSLFVLKIKMSAIFYYLPPVFSSCFFFCFFQIGAYDQQIWEKSVEQREIKVRLIRLTLSGVSFIFQFVFSFFSFMSLLHLPSFLSCSLFLTTLSVLSPVFCFVFSFNSLLSALTAGCLRARHSSLRLHPFFSIRLFPQFISLVSTQQGGAAVPHVFPTVHVRSPHAVDR